MFLLGLPAEAQVCLVPSQILQPQIVLPSPGFYMCVDNTAAYVLAISYLTKLYSLEAIR